MEQYIIYIGDDLIECFTELSEAVTAYNKLPDGSGKRWGLRRKLVKEVTVMEDSR